MSRLADELSDEDLDDKAWAEHPPFDNRKKQNKLPLGRSTPKAETPAEAPAFQHPLQRIAVKRATDPRQRPTRLRGPFGG